MYRHGGRLRRLTLGTYPPLTLADARAKAKDALRRAALGADPAAEKKADRLAETVTELAALYLEGSSEKSVGELWFGKLAKCVI